MKQTIIILMSILAFAMSSCGNKEEQAKSEFTKDSLQQLVTAKDSIINQAFMDIDEIATTLGQISEREKIVATQSNGEITVTTKSQITDNINAISDLLAKNRKAIASLQASSRKLKEANVKIEALEALVISLQSQIDGKNVEIAAMSEKLAKLNIEVAALTQNVQNLESDKSELQKDVAQKTEEINTVYYIIGSEKDLLKRDIINKEGFIGRTAVVGSNNMAEFTKGDLRNVERISIGGKKAKIVTSHPKESYTLVMGANKVVEELIISDSKAFWSNSKVLIVSYK